MLFEQKLLARPATTASKPVEDYAQIKDDAKAMLEMLDQGIMHNGRRARSIALHHAQFSAKPFNFFVVASEYKKMFNGRRVIINPTIKDQKEYVPYQEACLSFLDRPNQKTRRFETIVASWQYADASGDIRNTLPTAWHFTGFESFVIQHEVDHGLGGNIYDGRFSEYNPKVALDKTK